MVNNDPVQKKIVKKKKEDVEFNLLLRLLKTLVRPWHVMISR